MRIFAGGHFNSDQGEIYPSLRTCDMIHPDSVVVIDGNKNTWKDILVNQLKEW